MTKLILNFIFLTIIMFSYISCVPASDDEFDEITINHMPLNSGNKWIYNITRGGESFSDSAEILDYFPYQVDELTNRYLYQYKEIPFTLEMALSDTLYVKLIEYDNWRLIQYGSEKRDSSGFLYGEPDIFEIPEVILDHSDITAVEELYISSLVVIDNGISRILNDTTVFCIRSESKLISGSFISGYLDYDLNFYYTEFGVLKIDGIVNNSAFSATAVSCTLK